MTDLAPDVRFEMEIPATLDVEGTLRILAMGRADPCLRADGPERVRVALAGPNGPIALLLRRRGERLRVRVRGARESEVRAWLPGFLGLEAPTPDFREPAGVVRLARDFHGLRLPRAPFITPRLVRVILQQLITVRDAYVGWGRLVRAEGDPIEGADDLIAPPAMERLARLPVADYVARSILPRHARVIRAVARRAPALEAAWGAGLRPDAAADTDRLLAAIPGVGPWTRSLLRGMAMGDQDVLLRGDDSLPRHVVHYLTGATDGDDDRMEALLEPFRPFRFLVATWIMKSGVRAPRRGPRGPELRDRLRGG